MRPERILPVWAIALCGIAGCNSSTVEAVDARVSGSDATITDAALDALPPPACGQRLVEARALCRTCVATGLELDPATGYFERFAHIAAPTDSAALVAFRGTADGALMARVEDGQATAFEAPLRGFASALLASTTLATYALGRDPANGSRALILPYDDNGQLGAPVAELSGLTGPGLAADSADCLHVLLNGDDGLELSRVVEGEVFAIRTYDGFRGWSGLAIDDAGATHVMYVTEQGLRWLAHSALSGAGGDAPVLADEIVDTADGSPGLREPRLAIVDNLPRALYTTSAGGARVLRYAVRDSSGWTHIDLGVDARLGCDPDIPPTGPGDTCAFTETTWHPIAVLTDADGDVRLLYGEAIEDAVLTAECGGEDLPPDTCTGWLRQSSYSGGLHVLTPGSGVDDVVLAGSAATTGRAVARADAIHVVLEVLIAQPVRGNALHYVRLASE